MAAGSREMAHNGRAQHFRALVKRNEGAKMAAGHPEASLNGEYLAHLERIKHGNPCPVQRCFSIAKVNPERINLAKRGTTVSCPKHNLVSYPSSGC